MYFPISSNVCSNVIVSTRNSSSVHSYICVCFITTRPKFKFIVPFREEPCRVQTRSNKKASTQNVYNSLFPDVFEQSSVLKFWRKQFSSMHGLINWSEISSLKGPSFPGLAQINNMSSVTQLKETVLYLPQEFVAQSVGFTFDVGKILI